jgi:hypothetical protein
MSLPPELPCRGVAEPLRSYLHRRQFSACFLCCSDADGTAVSDVDWESKDGRYRVRLGGEWIDVPDDALVTVPNRAGRTMIWPMPMIEGDTIKIRCFMPGSMI